MNYKQTEAIVDWQKEMDEILPGHLPVSGQIKVIEHHFRKIMLALGLDLTDDSLQHTPLRVAKMYVNEAFSGLNPLNEPAVTLFDNKYAYGEIILEKNIPVYSYCEHHFVPIIGKAHVAYIP
ncbi:MAG TPA: GTP cyclohydrolase I, partial [Chitinophagaceae bacterium]|nr:GTP cyclohydrolase I [Chitinophagaceae bacterium]